MGDPLPLRALALLAEARRQFDLPRWTRSQEFRDLHSTSVAWLESHFELIERGAPWLHRVGSDVRDFCSGRVTGLTFDLTPHFKANVGCAREVTAVYGFDGPQLARLRSLDQAMPAAGWAMGTSATRQTTRNYLPLEISESSVPELLEQALAEHEHALTVAIRLSYYSISSTRAWRHGVARYILPARPRLTNRLPFVQRSTSEPTTKEAA